MNIPIGRARAAATGRITAAAALAVAALLAVGPETGGGRAAAGPPAAGRRSRPPVGPWDPTTLGTFLPDAFSTLEGPRPSFAPPADQGLPSAAAAGEAQPVAIRWSALVSADTLADEVKDAKAALEAACAKPGTFKGGGFEAARTSFGTLAVAFGVIAAYDRDARWKTDAAVARDLFARAGAACAAGTDAAFAEATARLDDLSAMLGGNRPAGRSDGTAGFRWSELAGRPALMERLEQARAALRPAVATPTDFAGRRADLLHAVEIVAVLGEILRQPDFADHDDDAYRGHSATMRDAAVEARAACERDDYEAARAAVGRIEKACADCHAEYRG